MRALLVGLLLALPAYAQEAEVPAEEVESPAEPPAEEAPAEEEPAEEPPAEEPPAEVPPDAPAEIAEEPPPKARPREVDGRLRLALDKFPCVYEGPVPYFAMAKEGKRPLEFYHCDYLRYREFQFEGPRADFERWDPPLQARHLNDVFLRAEEEWLRFVEARREDVAEADPARAEGETPTARARALERLRQRLEGDAGANVRRFRDDVVWLNEHLYVLRDDLHRDFEKHAALARYLDEYLVAFVRLNDAIQGELARLEKGELPKDIKRLENQIQTQALDIERLQRNMDDPFWAERFAEAQGRTFDGSRRSEGAVYARSLSAAPAPRTPFLEGAGRAGDPVAEAARQAALGRQRLAHRIDDAVVPEPKAPAEEAGSRGLLAIIAVGVVGAGAAAGAIAARAVKGEGG